MQGTEKCCCWRLSRFIAATVIGLSVATGGYSVHAATVYVATNSPSDGPGTGWANAFHTIQDAVDAAGAGDTVLVTNGVYAAGGALTPGNTVSNRVCIRSAITVQSVNGPASTIILGAGPIGSNAVRCAFLSSGVLAGFTLTNGNAQTTGDKVYNRGAGGVFLDGGGTVSNCVIIGNQAADGNEGGGAILYYGGTLNACTIANNGTDCRVTGGGVYALYGGTINACTITGNGNNTASGEVYAEGGGVYLDCGGALNNSTLSGNRGGYGAGVFCNCDGMVNACIISNNIAGEKGGGGGVECDNGVTVCNCLIVGNNGGGGSGWGGGGVLFFSGGTLANCTIVGNTVSRRPGGGVMLERGGTLVNSIVYGNTDPGFNPVYANIDDYGGSVQYTCCPGLGGTGNIGSDPQFADAAAGNYRLLVTSPCIDAGNNGDTQGATDLDGYPRVNPGAVDMGAYEYPFVSVTITNSATTVPVSQDTIVIGGTNTGYASGYMRCTNAANGASTTFPAQASWLTPAIALAYGDNVLTVTATNSIGLSASDTVTVTRQFPLVTYVAPGGANVQPFDTWARAATTIQAAVDRTADGGTVWVSNGVYAAGGATVGSPAISNRVSITRAVTVQSVNGAAVTIIKGAADHATGGLGTNATRCVYMTAGVLAGFTLTNGFTRADNDWNLHRGGGGALVQGGTVSNCVVAGCTASYFGGGLDLFGSSARAWYCTVARNTAYDGGGLYLQYGGSAFNCLISSNRATDVGGGVRVSQSGTLVNCTVAGNSAAVAGGGVYCYQGGSNLNTIVYANTTNNVPNNWTTNAGGAFAYCCTTPNPGGTGNTAGDPLFLNLAAGDCRIRAGSSCYNHGLNAFAAGATDLAGHPRITDTTVDMGAYEIAFPSTAITNTATSVPWNQSSIVIGGTNNVFVAGAMSYANEASGASGAFPSQPIWTTPPIGLNYGQNPISVTVSNDEGDTWSDSITITRQMPTVAYVAPGGSNTWPYDSWANAATTIQPAADTVPAGGTVWVSNGVYAAGGKLTPLFTL